MSPGLLTSARPPGPLAAGAERGLGRRQHVATGGCARFRTASLRIRPRARHSFCHRISIERGENSTWHTAISATNLTNDDGEMATEATAIVTIADRRRTPPAASMIAASRRGRDRPRNGAPTHLQQPAPDDHYRSWRDQHMTRSTATMRTIAASASSSSTAISTTGGSQQYGNPQPLRTGMTQTGDAHDPSGNDPRPPMTASLQRRAGSDPDGDRDTGNHARCSDRPQRSALSDTSGPAAGRRGSALDDDLGADPGHAVELLGELHRQADAAVARRDSPGSRRRGRRCRIRRCAA